MRHFETVAFYFWRGKKRREGKKSGAKKNGFWWVRETKHDFVVLITHLFTLLRIFSHSKRRMRERNKYGNGNKNETVKVKCEWRKKWHVRPVAKVKNSICIDLTLLVFVHLFFSSSFAPHPSSSSSSFFSVLFSILSGEHLFFIHNHIHNGSNETMDRHVHALHECAHAY